ncbi:MAG: alpha/beta hydrolase [Candidatus Hydrogenedentota bacterium]
MYALSCRHAIVCAAALWLGASHAAAEDYEARLDENRAALEAYFKAHMETLTEESRLAIANPDEWPERREQYRDELAYMLGLDPMPEDAPLNAEITGTIEHEEFTVEKVHFQSLPGLYVTGNLYIPNNLDEPAPTILYLCGHARRVEDGVSLGNKAAYQHHPAWFARHGYVSLVVDTIQLGEIEGLHHGTHREGMWWWNSRGYTPAGVEAFNAMRALDYLETREEVDAERFGVTGRSGGGIGTLFLSALDERVAVAAPVAGITSIQSHFEDDLPPHHCDCNYFPNLYRFDYPRIVSLIAPRPLLIANSDRDAIFPLDGVQRVHKQVRDVYEALGAEEELGLVITVGEHADTQQLRVPVFSWFNRHLKGEDPLIDQPAEPLLDEADLRVFDEIPEDEIVTTIHDTFVPAADVETPEDASAWEAQRDEFMEQLKSNTFGNWPEAYPAFEPAQVFSAEREGVHLEAWDFTVEPHVELRLYLARATAVEEPDNVLLLVLDEEGWRDGMASMAAEFGGVLPEYPGVEPDPEQFQQSVQLLEASNAVWAVLTPRGVGPAAWAEPDSSDAVHPRRSFPILGQTLHGQQVLDILRTLEFLREHGIAADRPINVFAREEKAALALYAAALDGNVDSLRLENLPASHHEGVELLNVMRFMDMPQALALALEHSEVHADTAEPAAWSYAQDVAALLGREEALNLE